MDTMLGVYKIRKQAELPQIQTRGSACFDLVACLLEHNVVKGYNCINEPITYYLHEKNGEVEIQMNPGDRMLIPTGLIFDIPVGYSVRVHNRSSIPLKRGLMLANNQGIIDSDYVEEIFLIMINMSNTVVTIKHGERLAQAELVKNIPQHLYEISDRPSQKTDRVGGLGSTGENSNGIVSIAGQVAA